MTTKVKITLEEFAGQPVNVTIVGHGQTPQIIACLQDAGESVETYVHQHQDVVVSEVNAN